MKMFNASVLHVAGRRLAMSNTTHGAHNGRQAASLDHSAAIFAVADLSGSCEVSKQVVGTAAGSFVPVLGVLVAGIGRVHDVAAPVAFPDGTAAGTAIRGDRERELEAGGGGATARP